MRRSLVLLLVALLAPVAGLGLFAAPASAGVCQECEDPPPPPPSPYPPPPPPPCYYAYFANMTSYDHEDSGGDELVLKLNSSTIWTFDHTDVTKQTQPVKVERYFRGGALLELKDEDWPDADDWLGTIGLDHTRITKVNYGTLVFDRNGANHHLSYWLTIVPDNQCH